MKQEPQPKRKPPVFFLYTRKSTDEEERQVQSIEAQLTELRELAQKDGLLIIEEFVEARTAKIPGRPIFDDMLRRIEQGEASGILAWHPDRLARNSVDGGRIIYLLDTGKLTHLKFPTFWFENTPQGKFMLNIAFGQSKYYVDNLSENVTRGMRQKVRLGVFPDRAPVGYYNHPKLRTIEVDEARAPLVQELFALAATGTHTLGALGRTMAEHGMVGRRGKPLSPSQTTKILTKPFYYGCFRWKGELHEGRHTPLISKQLFDQVQRVLHERSRKTGRASHPFPFVGLARCGECGASITAQYAHGHGGTYVYYRCTKKMGPCSQRYLRDRDFAAQVQSFIEHVSLSDAWTEKMLAKIATWRKDAAASVTAALDTLRKRLAPIEKKLALLLDAYLEGLIGSEEYQAKKLDLVNTKVELQEKIRLQETRGESWLEPLERFIKAAHEAKNLVAAGREEDQKNFLKTIGSNHRLLGQNLRYEVTGAWSILQNRDDRCTWWALVDSNHGPHPYQGCALTT